MLKLFLLLFNFLFASEIFIASASNSIYVLPKIIKEFNKKYPTIKVHTIFASSGKLTAQIINGAKYDVFLSADEKYPNVLYEKRLSSKPKIYAKGKLAIFNKKDINSSDIKKILLNANSIAIANPKNAPYGKASIEVFKSLGIYKNIKHKLIYAPNVSGVIAYVINYADIGLVAKSSFYTSKMKKFKFIDISLNLYTPINQAVVLLTNNKDAIKLYNFLFSKKAKEIFRQYGYN